MGNNLAFNSHVELITLTIENNRELSSLVYGIENDVMECLRTDVNFDVEDIVATEAFFELRVKANRKVIDTEHFHPTKREMDAALKMQAENLMDDIIAYEDITNHDFYC